MLRRSPSIPAFTSAAAQVHERRREVGYEGLEAQTVLERRFGVSPSPMLKQKPGDE